MNNGQNINNNQVNDDRLVMPQNMPPVDTPETINNNTQNINNPEIVPKKKKTIAISSEGLIFIVIAIIILLFIFSLPTIHGYITNLL